MGWGGLFKPCLPAMGKDAKKDQAPAAAPAAAAAKAAPAAAPPAPFSLQKVALWIITAFMAQDVSNKASVFKGWPIPSVYGNTEEEGKIYPFFLLGFTMVIQVATVLFLYLDRPVGLLMLFAYCGGWAHSLGTVFDIEKGPEWTDYAALFVIALLGMLNMTNKGARFSQVLGLRSAKKMTFVKLCGLAAGVGVLYSAAGHRL